MSVTIVQGQQRLALVWGIGSGIAALILVVESFNPTLWGSFVNDAWQWFLALIIPFLTLIVSSVVAEAAKHAPSKAEANDLAFGIALWLSIIYIVAIVIAVIGAALIHDKPITIFRLSSLWLTPLQLLVGSSLGVFFTQRKRGN